MFGLGINEGLLILLVITVLIVWNLIRENKILEQALTGEDVYRELKEKGLIVSGVNERFEQIINKFSRIDSLSRFNICAYTSSEEGINAGILPGGQIYFTKGFIQFIEEYGISDDEIAGVVGHELAHLARGHSEERTMRIIRMNRFRNLFLIISNFFIPLTRWKAGALRQVTKFAMYFTKLKYNRGDEFESDQYGIMFLQQSPYKIDGLTKITEKVAALAGNRSIPYWLSTHPPLNERIKRMSKFEKQLDLLQKDKQE